MSLQILLFLALMSIPQEAQSAYCSINCSNSLGMQSGKIKDEDITASSCHSTQSLPKLARLESETDGGAWCPNASDKTPWLQIHLHQIHILTSISIQGRYGKGQGQEYVEYYTLHYYDPFHQKWQLYINKTKSENIRGNNDTNSIKKTILDNPIIADKIRIFPIKATMTMCLRVELYGCLWPEEIVRIDVQQGSGKPLENGAALLLDCIIPSSDTDEGWMVWSTETLQDQPLEISFAFNKIRAFQAVHLFVKEPFKSANITFSIDGEYYSNPLMWEPGEDSNLTYNLDNQIGRYLKMQLIAKGQWLFLGEIDFDSSLNYYNYYRCSRIIDSKTFIDLLIYISIGIVLLLIICIISLAIVKCLCPKKQRYVEESTRSRFYQNLDSKNLDLSTVSATDEFTYLPNTRR